jgi:flagellin-specific chaperone FliS
MSASPEQLISYIYDAILIACRNADQERVLRGVSSLMDALNFKYEGIAVPMFQMYQYCQEQARQKNFEQVESIITEFKSAWSEAMNVS